MSQTALITGALKAYADHMASHPGNVERASVTAPLTLQVGTLRGTANSSGICYSREIAPRCYSTLSFLSVAAFAQLDAEMGLDAVAELNAHVEASRCGDAIEAARAGREQAAIDVWVAQRIALRAEIAAVMASCPTCYVRQGKVSAGHCSYNFRDQFAEAGCSVFAAKQFQGRYYIAEGGASAPWFTPDTLCTGSLLAQTGSDGEPLIAVTSSSKINATAVTIL